MVDFAKHVKRKPRIDLNPSSADRWMTCTASPKFILDNWAKLPPEDRTFSDPGNTAHEVASALLQDRQPDLANCPVPIDKEMLWHGWQYMEFVQDLVQPGGKLLVEQKLPLFYAEGRNAIVDAAIINPDHLHIVDYKYGEGVIVSPEDNLQATIYAKSVTWNWSKFGFPGKLIGNGMSQAFDKPDDFPIFVSIYQPRSRNAADAPFHTWRTTWGEIKARGRQIFDTAVNILAVTDPINPRPGDLVFAPSDKACQFCPARQICTARHAVLTAEIEPLQSIQPGPKHLPPVKAVTLRQLAAIVQHGDAIIKWINDAKDYALSYAKAGNKVPGQKLVLSRGGNRYWLNPHQAAKLLIKDSILREDEVYEKKVIGPAAAEKLIGKNKFSVSLTNLIGKPPGQPILVPESDPREEYGVDALTEFEPLDDEQRKINLDQF